MRMTLKDYKLLAFLLVVASLAVAYFDNQNTSGMGVLTQAGDAASKRREARAAAAEQERVSAQEKNAASDRLVWLDNYQAAIKESKATGKPIFLEFRCAP
jgi:cellobiose-specific phosphotransferase system component IIA